MTFVCKAITWSSLLYSLAMVYVLGQNLISVLALTSYINDSTLLGSAAQFSIIIHVLKCKKLSYLLAKWITVTSSTQGANYITL